MGHWDWYKYLKNHGLGLMLPRSGYLTFVILCKNIDCCTVITIYKSYPLFIRQLECPDDHV